MKLIWAEKAPEQQRQLDESDAMKGKYDLEDLLQRKRQHFANTIPNVSGKTITDEDPIDTLLRQMSIVTNGQGALGRDSPNTPQQRIAYERLITATRWARATLSENNRLRKFLERVVLQDKPHTIFDRSVERDEPQVVLTYKPMLYPGPGVPVQNVSGSDDKLDKEKKKP